MTLKARQAEALKLLKKGKNVFLSGEAGTGKSFVIEQFKKYLDKKNKKYVVCAPTGLAALNVEGATLHRTFKLSTDFGDDQIDLKNVEEAEVIIIDEISMCRRDVFQYIARALIEFEKPLEEFNIAREKKVCRKKQIVVVGDFFQLPPVIGANDKKIIKQMKERDEEIEADFYKHLTNLEETLYAFQCDEWKKLKFKSIVLNEVVRQSDKDYIDNLNKIRRGDSEGLKFIKKESSKEEIEKAIYLTSKNRDADNINQNNLDKIKSREYIYYGVDDGEVSEQDKPVPKYLKLKIGARVMSVVNITNKDKKDEDSDEIEMGEALVVNGMLGTVIDLKETSVTVEFDNGYTHTFEKYKWSIKGFKEQVEQKDGKSIKKMVMSEIGSYRQIPLKLSWAITIHKSQGQTYEGINLNPDCFCEGQLYVGLSRAKDLKKLYLTTPIKKSYLKTSDVVKEFYDLIEKGELEPDDTEVEDDQVTEELFEEEKEEYVTIEVPKHLEKTVLSLIKNEHDTNIGNEEVVALKRQIESLEEQVKRLQTSSKRRPRIEGEKELEIIRLRQSGISISRIAKMVEVGNGTVQRVLKENDIK